MPSAVPPTWLQPPAQAAAAGRHQRPHVTVVLGEALLPNGTAPLDTQLRCRLAAAMYEEVGGRVIASGGRTGARRSEAAAMRELLVARGVPSAAVELEAASQDTVHNAANVLRMLTRGVRKEPLELDLVTSAFHMPRAAYLFEVLAAKRWGWLGGVPAVIRRHGAASDPEALCRRIDDELAHFEQGYVLTALAAVNVTATRAEVPFQRAQRELRQRQHALSARCGSRRRP